MIHTCLFTPLLCHASMVKAAVFQVKLSVNVNVFACHSVLNFRFSIQKSNKGLYNSKKISASGRGQNRLFGTQDREATQFPGF